MTRTTYTLLLYLLLPFTLLKLLWRARKQPEYLNHWRERYGFYHAANHKPVIWLHCVSVGETRAAAPLIKALLRQYPKHQILLTHTTPTGRAASEQLFGDTIQRVYLPYDVPFAVNGFLKKFKPLLGVLMETELWFNLIASCKRQDIPLLLVNARLSEKSALGYAKIGKLVEGGLQSLSAIAAQTATDAARLKQLGADNVSIVGNLKFDVMPPEDAATQGQKLRALLGENRSVLLAASTREAEEAIVLDASTNIPNLLTIIVPRHPQRFSEVESLLKQRGLRYQKRSSLNQPINQDTRYILGDSMGELFTYYAASDIALIGGSLLPFGGQNLIEAAIMGKPILIGPHTYNFAEATQSGVEAGAVIQLNNAAELSGKIEYLINNKSICEQMGVAATRFSQASTGATEKVLQLLARHLVSGAG